MGTFRAFLTGRNEVPPVRTVATGNAVFQLSSNGNQLRFRLVVKNIERVTQAHIHLGRRGRNGPVVVFLFGPSKFGISVKRGIVRGVLTSRDLVGPLQGKTLRNLIREIERGNTYVNVHTIQHPDGEIRGQITR
ncbi:CHRD domain-containing protein [Paenibacillus agricola]|uniref:CHRD domain-containing protein n=1 Tax=Paenibacillus agricola TaxID=2716264 RepID=A0ABX0JKA9_9BACL|nr:CHRD domain-containing protein [Paenibacillus agricola]NHN35308.1 CHRD domain-containing protein [Paenibacillus agricola]